MERAHSIGIFRGCNSEQFKQLLLFYYVHEDIDVYKFYNLFGLSAGLVSIAVDHPGEGSAWDEEFQSQADSGTTVS